MATIKRKGLGKGLDSLIPKIEMEQISDSVQTEDGKKIPEVKPDMYVKISRVEPNKNQPRKQFEGEALKELAASIKQYGVIQPLIVQKRDDYYEIIAGERRWRAAKAAGLKEVPVIIKEYSDQEIAEISLIENIQREDLNPIEEALGFKRLQEEFGLKQDEIAKKVSKSRTAVANSMRLLKLEERVREMLSEGKISAGHARPLLALEDGEDQYQIAVKIVENELNVRDTEKLIKKIEKDKAKAQKAKTEQKQPDQSFIYEDMEERIKAVFGTQVHVNHKRNNKGKIEIEYYSQDELERIYDLLISLRQ